MPLVVTLHFHFDILPTLTTIQFFAFPTHFSLLYPTIAASSARGGPSDYLKLSVRTLFVSLYEVETCWLSDLNLFVVSY